MAKTKKVRSREVTFEGKNIHFSPLDNKPLCSFSNKLCRQRRLNGYAFCIRHILEDKSSPFKQCDFVTRNNGQRCLNAIPSNQERGYCHSHMQVAGIIPKTERKVKPAGAASNQSGGSGKDSDSKKENKKKSSVRAESNLSSTTTGSPPTASSKPTRTKKNSTPSKPKGKSIPPMIKDSTNAKESDLCDLLDSRPEHLNGKPQTESLPRKNTRSSTQINDSITKKAAKQKPSVTAVPVTQLKKENFDGVNGGGNLDLDFQYEQQKTLNISDYSNAVPIIDAKLVKDEKLHLDIPTRSLGGTDEFVLNPPFLKLQKESDVPSYAVNSRKLGNGKCYETRQEFLSRVRSAFKSHYKMFRRAYKLNENHEEGNKPFRESLLSCVLADPRMSVKMLTNSQIGKSKADEKSSNRMCDKNSHVMPVNFQSNKNKLPVTAHDAVGYLSSSFLRDFDENLSSEQFKESKFCDSSPWMNDGIQDVQLGNMKKAKLANQTSKAYSDGGKIPSRKNQRTVTNVSNGFSENSKGRSHSSFPTHSGLGIGNGTEVSHSTRKRRIDLDNDLDELEHNLGLGLDDAAVVNENHLLGPSHYSSVAQFETVLTSVSSSETTGTPDGVITDASFDSPFDHSTSSQPDCDFSDDVDLEKTFELQIDPEIAHQASRLLENNELTEDDFNELFPETRSITDHKLSGDLGIDFTTTFDADIDYTLFANIFPNFRSNNSSEVISVTQNF